MQHRASHAPFFKLHPVQLPVEPPLVSYTAVCVDLSKSERKSCHEFNHVQGFLFRLKLTT